MLKHITQRKPTECRAACVAILCRIGIAEARSLLGQSRSQHTGWTGTDEIRMALAFKELRLGREIYCEDWSALKEKTKPLLISVNYKEWITKTGKDKVRWHWAVYKPLDAATPVLDPLKKSGPRAPGRTRLYSYFHVHRLSDA